LRENAGHENAGQENVCIEFVTSSRRLPTIIWNLNMLRIYPVELSRVELCRRCVRAYVGSRDPVYNSAANGVGLEVAGSRLATAASCLRYLHRRHDATRLRCRQTVQTRRECRQLVANLIHTADATRRRRCVLGLKLHSYKNDVANTNVVKINIYREK